MGGTPPSKPIQVVITRNKATMGKRQCQPGSCPCLRANGIMIIFGVFLNMADPHIIQYTISFLDNKPAISGDSRF